VVRGHAPPDDSVADPANHRSVPLGIGPCLFGARNDRAYGHVFTTRVRAMGIRDRPISPGSPWQNGIAERLIGTLRRECRDHMVIFGEPHLRRILSAYAVYYNQTRTPPPIPPPPPPIPPPPPAVSGRTAGLKADGAIRRPSFTDENLLPIRRFQSSLKRSPLGMILDFRERRRLING
jgi:hypothetical protein